MNQYADDVTHHTTFLFIYLFICSKCLSREKAFVLFILFEVFNVGESNVEHAEAEVCWDEAVHYTHTHTH